MNLAERVDSLLPDLPEVLIRVAREHFADEAQSATRRAIIRKAEALIEKSQLPEDRLCYLRGSVWAAKDQPLKAIRYLSQAVKLRPDDAAYRYELAQLMQRRGMIDQAREQVGICARIAPGDPKYENLLRQLIRTELMQGTSGQADTRRP
jgi:tetratricopeptide (TPR) repeat protein